MKDRQSDLTRDTLAVVFLFVLIAASVWILLPFLGATVWAIMIVVSTWPVLLKLQGWLWGRRWLAVTVMTLLLLAVFLVPFSIGIGTLVQNFDVITSWATSVSTLSLPPPPEWLGKVPLVGARASSKWLEFATLSREQLTTQLSPYLGGVVRWVAQQIGGLGLLLAQIVLTVLVAAVFYASGESAAELILRFGARLAGDRGEQAVRLAGQAIRGVALGVVLTALVHALLGGIGLVVAGVPFAILLTAVMFISAIVQVGVVPILLCAVVWLYWTGQTTSGTVLLIWTIVVAPVDNILRPILIKQGADLPLLLIIAGVVGGMFAFGIVGIFVGPVVLAVAYTLFMAWISGDEGTHRIGQVPEAHAEGSVLMEVGDTKVVCTASVEDKVPPFLMKTGKGWVTAEYGMLPRATSERTQREAARGKLGGRTMEIQRLIGRSLRAAIDPEALGERTIWLDCDVMQADGGTRTASITGAFVALTLAMARLYLDRRLVGWPLRAWVSAVSVGMVGGAPCLDLTYEEDARAEVDMNVVATDKMRFVELQGTGEGNSFSEDEMNAMLALARRGIAALIDKQREVLSPTIAQVDAMAMQRLTKKFR